MGDRAAMTPLEAALAEIDALSGLVWEMERTQWMLEIALAREVRRREALERALAQS